MIRVTLTPECVNAIDFAVSPLWEAAASLAMLLRPDRGIPPAHRAWVARTRRELPAALVNELPGVYATLRMHDRADCLLPVPRSRRPRIDDELAALLENGLHDPCIVTAAAVLDQYWHTALAEPWTEVEPSLEREVDQLLKLRISRGGPAALRALRGRVAWRPPALVAPYQLDLDRANEKAFALVPMVFAVGMRIFVADRDGAALSYQSTRVAFRDRPTTRTPENGYRRDPLSLLLGEGRARVLRALETPATTTFIASQTGMAKSTISGHLANLSEARVLRRERRGPEVFYYLDHAGFALLRYLSDT